jgi:AcrR family transcriptional regulator
VTGAVDSDTTGQVRRRLPRDERARQLLDVADAVFAEDGVQASSMAEIAERAGVTKPIVYDHFGSKDGLVSAVVLRAGSVLAAAVLEAASAAPDPEQAVAQGLRAYFRFIDERRTGLHSLLCEGVAPGTEAAAALERVRDQQAELIAGLLVAHSDVADLDRARVYAQIVIGGTERLATRPGTATPAVETLTQHVMDVIWCGFAGLRDGSRWSASSN